MVPRKTTKTPVKRTRTVEAPGTGLATLPKGDSAHVSALKQHCPSFSQVQVRAYEIFLARGGAHGHDLADWFRAEHELSATAGEPN